MSTRVERRSSRILVLDGIRGYAILVIAYGDLHILWMDNAFTRAIDHSEWAGLTYWDLGQAAFLLIAGMSAAISSERRLARGESGGARVRHALFRTAILYLVGVALVYLTSGEATLRPTGVLQTIALGYAIAFGFQFLKTRVQLASLVVIPMLHDLLFFLFPGPGGPFAREQNVGLAIDRTLFGATDTGGYVSLNVLGASGFVILGFWTVRYLRGEHRAVHRMAPAVVIFGLLAVGLWLAGVPIVKRLWTSSYHFLVAAALYVHLSLFGYAARLGIIRKVFVSFAVVGRHALLLYVLVCVTGWRVADLVHAAILPLSPGPFLEHLIPPVAAATSFWILAYGLEWIRKRTKREASA